MEEVIFLPFSSIVAGMLLYKRQITCVEIINFISLLGKDNIFVDDEIDDDIDSLLFCIDCFNYNSFRIKDNMSYDTHLIENLTVRDFLISKSDVCIFHFIEKNGYFSEFDSNVIVKRKYK